MRDVNVLCVSVVICVIAHQAKMSEALVFYNPRKGSCPTYVQDDVPVGLVKPLKDLIEKSGGLVTEDPQKAIIIVIIDRNTHLGTKLITDYAGESSGKGVVNQAWVLDSIRQGHILGPPAWGGYAQRRHTAQTYFDNFPDETMPSTTHTPSPFTMGTERSYLQSTGQTALSSPGSPGSSPSVAAPIGPSVSQKQVKFVPEATPLARQASSTEPRTYAPYGFGAQPSESTEASRPQKAKHAQNICMKSQITRENEAGCQRKKASPTPQPPPEEDKVPIGKKKRTFAFTKAEQAYIRSRFERARAGGPVFFTPLAATISKAIPWHPAKSVLNYMYRNKWHIKYPTKETLPAGGSKPNSGQLLRGAPRPVPNDTEQRQSAGSPTRDDDNRKRQSEDVEPQTSSRSAIIKGRTSGDTDRRARGNTSSGKGKAPSAITEPVVEAMILVLKNNPGSHWARGNKQKCARLWSDFAKTHPNHSPGSYYQYHIQHHKRLEFAARELMEDKPPTDALGHSGRDSKAQRSVSSHVDSLIEDGKLEDRVTYLISKLGESFDRKDSLAVIQYLADNPSLFYGSIEVPVGVTSTKVALWEKFTAKYNTRNRRSWAEFHRLHQVALERAARKLISIRQARKRCDDHQDPDSSSMAHTTMNIQPRAIIGTEQPTKIGFLSRFQNLLKRPIRDAAESSPSKRIKIEESLP